MEANHAVAVFNESKRCLLQSLAEGIDLSPKGSIDRPVLELVNFINHYLPDYVTTSSCSGRISVYRETQTKGIHWLLVVHGVITSAMLKQAISAHDLSSSDADTSAAFVVLKCEGFILHVHCRDVESGRRMHQVAMGSGFRESGLSIGQKKVQLAIRTTSYGMELPIAVGTKLLLDDFAVDVIVAEANRRLLSNFSRTDRLLTALKTAFHWPVLRLLPQPSADLSASPSKALITGKHRSQRRRRSVSSVMQRWGHCCVTEDESAKEMSVVVVGGYGVDQLDHNPDLLPPQSAASTRKLHNMQLTLALGVDGGTVNDAMVEEAVPFDLMYTPSSSSSDVDTQRQGQDSRVDGVLDHSMHAQVSNTPHHYISTHLLPLHIKHPLPLRIYTSTHPIDTHQQHTLSTHPINSPYQHPINTLSSLDEKIIHQSLYTYTGSVVFTAWTALPLIVWRARIPSAGYPIPYQQHTLLLL